MSPSWTSVKWNDWLSVEYYIQWHDPFNVDNWLEEDPENKAHLLLDPLDLGE
jgi:hypothetical protein